MKRVAILGGTFNPIHNGHIIVLQYLLDSAYCDEVWIMPAGQQPFKEISVNSKHHRLGMCKVVCDLMPNINLSTVEIDLDGPSYTYDTLTRLNNQFPTYKFFWTLGYDNLDLMPSWYRGSELLSQFDFIVVNRGGYPAHSANQLLEEMHGHYGTHFEQITIPNIELSSSQLRDRTKAGKSLLGYTLEPIIDYIHQNQLYG